MSDTYNIRLVRNESEINNASKIITKMYAWRGYETNSSPPMILDNPNQKTIVMDKNGEIVGTLTVRVDSNLYLEKNYGSVLEQFKTPERKACEIIKLAINENIKSRRATLGLYQMSFFFAISQGVTDFLIEVNPRHTLFYKRTFNFYKLSEFTDHYVGAPADLLHVETKNVPLKRMKHSAEEIDNEIVKILPSKNYPVLSHYIEMFNSRVPEHV